MSLLVFAGSAQFVALGLWIAPIPVAALVVTTFVVNLRHLLMGAALRPVLDDMPRPLAYAAIFLMTDESWALTMSERAKGRGGSGFFIGGGLAIYAAWVAATVVGRTAGAALHDPARWGLDFAFTAVFIALLARLWNGMANMLPWTAAAIVGIAAHHMLPGKWYILLGGLAGGAIGALRHDR
jgi:4-azaleucine resistance transporter AzlC